MNPNEGFNKITVSNLRLHQSVQSIENTGQLRFQKHTRPPQPPNGAEQVRRQTEKGWTRLTPVPSFQEALKHSCSTERGAVPSNTALLHTPAPIMFPTIQRGNRAQQQPCKFMEIVPWKRRSAEEDEHPQHCNTDTCC